MKKNFLFLTGRCDDIVINGGENISLSNIKNILFKHKDISDVYLDTKYDDNIGTKISAFIEVSKDNLSVQDIHEYLLKYLSKNQCPETIQIVDQIHHD
jgi:acyl-CoA synthetase (AMP-forming)/AMP-acid ligase II